MRSSGNRARFAVRVRGLVQGVGFRPFAYALATDLGLAGVVRNATGGVELEVEGDPADIDRFLHRLEHEPPPLARDLVFERAAMAPCFDQSFRIEPSAETSATPFVLPDASTCAACLAEIFDEHDRRFGHPFATCTACGPRFTIVIAAPYDRARTTMAEFAMCARCHAEYTDPRDRRFHAQPVACPECGPKLTGTIAGAATALAAGKIVAVKGLGGYHLAVDARNPDAIANLRARKARDAKPFAVMVRTLAEANELAELSAIEGELLASAARPIVLVRRRVLLPGIAPASERVGLVLAYTPIHHLLLRATGTPLVMTSGNVSDEPIAFEDADAQKRLGAIADVFLAHDRPIHVRCDDSIAHVVDGAPAVLRRARGHAPAPLRLSSSLACPTAALGGQLKAAFALGNGRDVFLSHHLGDLEHVAALRSFRPTLAHYAKLFRIDAERAVHDLHPDYATTAIAGELGLPSIAVQHHEAHVAAVLAENGVTGRAIGVAFDGAGYGTDGAIWGGEFFTGTAGHLERVAHLAYVPLPGGAMRVPARMAGAYLGTEKGVLRTSSIGRLFDAVAFLVCDHGPIAFEGQAAMALQTAAERAARRGERGREYRLDDLDAAPLVQAIADDVARGVDRDAIALGFHEAVAHAIETTSLRLRDGIDDVALGGGVFANVLLVELTARRLRAQGLRVHLARAVPTNDGGIAFGQLAVVAARDERRSA